MTKVKPRSPTLSAYSFNLLNIIRHVCHSVFWNVPEYLKPIAEEERRVEEAEKKIREEQERIYKQLSDGTTCQAEHILPACPDSKRILFQ